MKLHTPHPPIETVRLSFRKKGYDYEYIMLDETTIEEVERFVKDTILKRVKIDPFYTGGRIGVDIRRYKGAKAGKSISVSLKDVITPSELKSIILQEVQGEK